MSQVWKVYKEKDHVSLSWCRCGRCAAAVVTRDKIYACNLCGYWYDTAEKQHSNRVVRLLIAGMVADNMLPMLD